MAWQCLTEEYKLDPTRLYATYFGGDDSAPCDTQARDIWLQYLPADRVLPFDAADNFWEMGATGPCGPCTEIHYDRIGGGRDAAALVNADLPDVIEIWNNVFIQFNREVGGELKPLPDQHVDTGMGFERLTSILQGVDSNYDTDIFIPIFEEIQRLTGAKAYAGKVGKDDEGFVDMAYRVIADHIRTLSFAIADGAVPSNDGRGYVLRRVLRRAVRYGRQNLGAKLGFFSKLVPTLVNHMSGTFPELKENQKRITQIIMEEEESFSRTLDKGLKEFKTRASKVTDNVFPGDDAHFLYTSMGFPVDLTELMAEELDMTLDKEGFEKKMEEEHAKSAAAHEAKMSGTSGKDMRFIAEQTSYLGSSGVNATDDSEKYAWNQELTGCNVSALFIGRGETEDGIGFVDEVAAANGAVGIVLDKTSFYGESGGQTNDTGVIKSESGAEMEIQNVQVFGQYILHTGVVTSGVFKKGDSAICSVDYERRTPIASNHTMTHVLNYALQDVLVTKAANSDQAVDQKGSLVDEEKLRFDFSWSGPLTTEQLAEVENQVSTTIVNAITVQSYMAPLKDAEQISSLRAVFGEKYPDPVRVVAVSPSSVTEILENPTSDSWKSYSVEFCGGTHIENTKDAKAFVLLKEEGIAKGIRRITAVTGKDAIAATEAGKAFEQKVVAAGILEGFELEKLIKTLTEELNGLSISAPLKDRLREVLSGYSKQVVAWKKVREAEKTKAVMEALIFAAEAAGDSNKVVCRVDGVDGKVPGAVQKAVGKKVKGKAFFLLSASDDEDKFLVVAFATKGLKDVDCEKWAKAATDGIDGKGFGRPQSAQYTFSGKEAIESVLEKANSF